jgi:hypothetical protein
MTRATEPKVSGPPAAASPAGESSLTALARTYRRAAKAWWLGAGLVVVATAAATSVRIVQIRHASTATARANDASERGVARESTDDYLDPAHTTAQSVPHPRRVLFERIDALSYDERHRGGEAAGHVGFLSPNTWLKYANVDFGPGANWFSAFVAVSDSSGGNTIEVRLRDPRGPIISALEVQSTGGWGFFQSQLAPMTPTSGVHDIYLTFSGGNSVANLAWFKFTRTPRPATERIAARTYDACYGTRDRDDSVGALDEDHWIRFGGIDFGTGVKSLSAELSVPADHAGRFLDVRLDGLTATPVAELQTKSTGDWDTPQVQSTTFPQIAGVHDVYLTFRGGNAVCNLSAIQFSR